jgi:hypothetical protein
MKITKEQQYLILGVVALLVIGGLYYQFMLKPVWANIDALRSTLTQKEKDLQEAKTIVRNTRNSRSGPPLSKGTRVVPESDPDLFGPRELLDTLQFCRAYGREIDRFCGYRATLKKEKYTEFPLGSSSPRASARCWLSSNR